MMQDRAPILVAGCGNPMAGADAFGPLLAELLQREPIEGVETVNLGTNPGGLLDALEDRLALVIADAAVVPDAAAGVLIDCDWDDADRPAHDCVASTHGLSIADQVELARSLGLLPRIVRLIAVTTVPQTALGPPSDAVTRQLAPARQRIARLARDVFASAHFPTEKQYV